MYRPRSPVGGALGMLSSALLMEWTSKVAVDIPLVYRSMEGGSKELVAPVLQPQAGFEGGGQFCCPEGGGGGGQFGWFHCPGCCQTWGCWEGFSPG